MKKVLIVDDDPFVLDIYSSLLKKEGFNVIIANNQQRALEKILGDCPDLLILDLNLNVKNPGPKDGIDILKTIGQNQRTKNLKIIVSSNYSKKDYPELSCLDELGVIKTFLKIEVSPDEMVKSVKEILQ